MSSLIPVHPQIVFVPSSAGCTGDPPVMILRHNAIQDPANNAHLEQPFKIFLKKSGFRLRGTPRDDYIFIHRKFSYFHNVFCITSVFTGFVIDEVESQDLCMYIA